MLGRGVPVVPDPNTRCFVCQPNEFTKKHIIKKLEKITIRKCPTGRARLVITPNQHVAFFRDLMNLKQNQSKLAAAAAIFGSDFGPCIEEMYNWFDEKQIRNFKISFGEGRYAADRHAEAVVKLMPREFLKVLSTADQKAYGLPKRCKTCSNEYLLSAEERKERVDAIKKAKKALGIEDKTEKKVKEEKKEEEPKKEPEKPEKPPEKDAKGDEKALPPTPPSKPASDSTPATPLEEEDEGEPECQSCRKRRANNKLNQPPPPPPVLEAPKPVHHMALKTEPLDPPPPPPSSSSASSPPPPSFPPPPTFPPSGQVYNPYGTPLPPTPNANVMPTPPNNPPPSQWPPSSWPPGAQPVARAAAPMASPLRGPPSIQQPPPPPPPPSPPVALPAGNMNRYAQYPPPDPSAGTKRKDPPREEGPGKQPRLESSSSASASAAAAMAPRPAGLPAGMQGLPGMPGMVMMSPGGLPPQMVQAGMYRPSMAPAVPPMNMAAAPRPSALPPWLAQ